MIKLSLSPDLEALRSDFRAWAARQNLPRLGAHGSLDDLIAAGRTWQRALAQSKFVGVHWPTEYGGRGLTLAHEAVLQEELGAVGAPQLLGLFGLTMVGPVLIEHATPDQKKRFLPRILDATEVWCQGFSEPGAGSDLGALSTKASPSGDSFILTGQKVWTSFAQVADWCFVLARTGQSTSKYDGISYLLVPMSSPGISVRPLAQITGEREFNEVFFDNVKVPRENLVGQEGSGWKIAISTLMYERVILTFARQLQSEVLLRKLVQKAADSGASIELVKLTAELATEGAAVRALAYQHLLSYSQGTRPGPEGSLDKLLWSEFFQRLTKATLRQIGIAGATNECSSPEVHQYLYSRGRTIAAGSSEIQRNIIAERVLGLPRTGK